MSPEPPDSNGSDAEQDSSEAAEWWVDRYILYSARESMLWGVLFVVLAHFAVFIASVGLAALRTHHPTAVVLSLLMVAGTAWGVHAEVRRKGKLAGFTWLLLATWVFSALTAVVGARLDLM